MLQALQDRSTTVGDKSHHLHARDIVINALISPTKYELQQQIIEQERRYAHLEMMIRRLAYSVLVHAAGRTSEEANAWIRENIPLDPGQDR